MWKNPSRTIRLIGELSGYAVIAVLFVAVRFPFLPAWWADFNSDYALVGIMAKHTLEGHFPIFFYGQTYMGGIEWATAALLAKVTGSSLITMDLLRITTLLWWGLAGAAWVWFLRQFSPLLAICVAAVYSLGGYEIIRLSAIQDLAAEYVFFGALLALYLSKIKSLLGLPGFGFGILMGLAWWTNQTVIFILVPALWVWHAEPGGWWNSACVRELRRPETGLRWLYLIAGALGLFGVAAGLAGGLKIPLGMGYWNLPNGITLTRDVFLVTLVIHLIKKYAPPRAFYRRRALFEVASRAWPLAAGFLLGYSPVWLGRIFSLYEKAPGIGLAVLPVAVLGEQFSDLLKHLDALIFSGLLYEFLGSIGPVFMLPIAAAVYLSAKQHWREPIVRLASFTILLNIIYVYFSFRARWAPVRYFYLTYFCFWIIVVRSLLQIRRIAWRAVGVALLITFGLFQNLNSSDRLTKYYESYRWRHDNISQMLGELRARNLSYCWGDLWSTYLLVYLSNEGLILSPHPDAPSNQVRVTDYFRRVEAARPACFIYHDAENRMRFSVTNPWR